MRKSLNLLALLCILALMAGCSSRIDGMGARVPKEEALRMAKHGSALVQPTYVDSYTAPPTVHVVYGKDKDGRNLAVFVYTSVIRSVYTDGLISAEKARGVAAGAGFPVEAIRDSSLQVFQGKLDDRDNPIFWLLSTNAGYIWVDAETEKVIKRLDAN